MIGTLLADTDQAIDDAVAHEVAQLATVELHLSEEASRGRLFPPLDVVRSGTSRDDALIGAKNAQVLDEFRRQALEASPVEVLNHLIEIAQKTSDIDTMVDSIKQVTPAVSRRS